MTLRSENCDSNGGERVLETWFLVLYTARPLTRIRWRRVRKLRILYLPIAFELLFLCYRFLFWMWHIDIIFQLEILS